MQIGVGLDARLGLPFADLRALARDAAELGFDSMWTPAGGIPDALHVCAAWSSLAFDIRPDGVVTGTSVVPAPRAWPPATLLQFATQAATVSVISRGRFVLGIGTGGYGDAHWRSLGLPNRPIAVMRDYVTCLRALLAGETVTHDGPAVSLSRARLQPGLPRVPVYLGALGDQMLGLAGSCADGVCLNWATPSRIADSRELVADGASRSGREPADVKLSMYIRVCIDSDEAAARRAFGSQTLGYALGRPGVPNTLGYRGMFGKQGFDDVLTELESRRASGEQLGRLVDDCPDDVLRAVGYWGRPDGAPAAFAELSRGLDEAIVRVVTTSADPDKVRLAMRTLTPDAIRAHQT